MNTLAGIQKHNKKSWSDYERYADHVYDEKYLLELFHNERDYEQQFLCATDSPLRLSNCEIGNWKSETNYKSRNGNDYFLYADFVAPVTGEYNIEVEYRTETEGTFISLWVIDGNEKNYYMKGSPEFRSRRREHYHLQKGEHTFQLNVNPNIHVIGITIKSITEYRADDSLKKDNRLTLIKASHKVSKMIGADELSFVLLYDASWKDPESLTNFLFDYRDEVNFHLINNNGDMEQVFGGYISSCTLNSNETELTVNCAGRLIDGEKRYIVEEMNIGGTASVLEDSYPKEYIRNFDNYNQAVEYLCDNYELSLNSNMHELITAKQYDNIPFDVSSAENFNRMKAENVKTELMPLGAYLRNNTGINQQRLFIYDEDWYNNSEPICLDNYPIFYITYGMGEAVTTLEVEEQATTDDGSGTTVGSTGGIITTNMMPSCGCCGGTVQYKRYQKSWKNYCPWCGKTGTLTDNPKGVYEGEITCSMRKGGCDADYCGYCGGDKGGYPRCKNKRLTPASGSETVNSGDTTSSKSKSTENLIKKIITECTKYSYGQYISTVQQMRKRGYGDDKAFSALIYSELTDMGIGAKLVQYNNGNVSDFQSVLVKNTDGKYVDFPYTNEEWKKHFGSVLNPTNASLTAQVVFQKDGNGVNIETGIVEGTGATSNGFDKDKPFKSWIVMEYSTLNEPNAPHHQAFLDFTASKPDNMPTWSGLTPLFLNNIINTSSTNIVDRLKEIWYLETGGTAEHIYLHRVYFEYIVHDEELYSSGDDNTDFSSYRMILREVGFRNGVVTNPVDLGATGKSINSILDQVCKSGELKMKFYPARYRENDKAIFVRDKSFNPSFTVDESKNVLGISSWSFNPASDYINRQLVVFKNKMEDESKGAVYNYTETRNPKELLRYGEINGITSLSDDISTQEAYYNARKEYDSRVGDSMTVTVFGVPPDLHEGDFVECLFEDSQYNDVKEVLSIEHDYDIKQAPHIQTKLGLNRPNPELAIRKQFEEERRVAKEHKTLFSRTAIYDEDTYTWEE